MKPLKTIVSCLGGHPADTETKVPSGWIYVASFCASHVIKRISSVWFFCNDYYDNCCTEGERGKGAKSWWFSCVNGAAHMCSPADRLSKTCLLLHETLRELLLLFSSILFNVKHGFIYRRCVFLTCFVLSKKISHNALLICPLKYIPSLFWTSEIKKTRIDIGLHTNK